MAISRSFTLLAMFAAPAIGSAQDAARGRELYEAYCFDCHYPRVHEMPRGRSEVQNLQHLRELVSSRATLTKHRFTEQEKADVVEYLNRSYYRLAK